MNNFTLGIQAAAGIFVLAVFLAVINERVNELLVKPLLAMAGHDMSRFLPYVALLTGVVLSAGFGLDLFAPLAAAFGLEPAQIVTVGLTAVLVGGGSNLLHDIWPGDG